MLIILDDLQSTQRLSECERSVDDLVEADNRGIQSIINHHSPFLFKLNHVQIGTFLVP